MTVLLIVVAAVVLGLAAGWWLPPNGRLGKRSATATAPTVRRILLPFTGTSISSRSLQAALRLCKAENATLMPAYLARVPRTLPLDAAVPRQASEAMPLLEAIEQQAHAQDVPVDTRIERGRTYRHALSRLLDGEKVDRVIVSANGDTDHGLSEEDLVWLLREAPAEVLILRPGPADDRVVSAAAVAGHF